MSSTGGNTMRAGTPIAERYAQRLELAKLYGGQILPYEYRHLAEELSASEERERVLREALEEAENKLRAHDGLVALKNGIPETTGDAVFDEVLRAFPVAHMIHREWLLGVTGFDDLPLLRRSLLRFFEADDLSDLLDFGFFRRKFSLPLATPAPEQPAKKEQHDELQARKS